MDRKFSKQELQVQEWFKRAQDDESGARIIVKGKAAPATACFRFK